MSDSIFFENAKLFQIPGSMYGQLPLAWLIVLWVFAKSFSKNKYSRELSSSRFNTIEYCIIGLIIISFIGFVRVIFEYYPDTTEIYDQFWVVISLFVAYFIIKNWISSNTPELVVQFLFCIVVINSIAAFFYVVHQGLHFDIYPGQEYESQSFQGQEITRTFWFMPQLPFFSIAFLLVFTKRYSFVSIGLLLVNLLGIVISYTISSVSIAIFVLFLYFILMGIKEGRVFKAVKNLILYALMGIVGVFLMSKLMPANTNYLKHRISEQTKSQYTQRDPNDLDIRFIHTAYMISQIDRDKKLLGMGPVTKFQSHKVEEMQANTADMAWSGVIFFWGFIGLLLFAVMFVFSFFRAFRLFLKSEGVISDLALMLLLCFISQFIESFVSWTFLSGHGFTIGLWYFAVLSSLPALSRISRFNADNDKLASDYS